MTPIDNDLRAINGKHDDLTAAIIGVFYGVYNELGYGFLESVYRGAMRLALSAVGLQVETEVSIPVNFRGEVIGVFRADLIVNRVVLIELKSCESLIRQHESQTLNYLKATTIEVALLMNFGPVPKFKRMTMDNEKKTVTSVEPVCIGVKSLAGGGTEWV